MSSVRSVSAIDPPSGAPRWLRRARFVLSLALIVGALHWIANAGGAIASTYRPAVLLGGPGSPLATLSVCLIVLLGTFVAARVLGLGGAHDALLVGAIALAALALPGGTMDHWLAYVQPLPTPPSGGPYARLLPDYLLLWLLIAATAAIGDSIWLTRARGTRAAAESVQSSLALNLTPAAWRRGLHALLITALVAALLIFILMGPRAAETYRGQVYFAVAVGMIGGVFAGYRVSGAAESVWYWSAPFVVGLVGIGLAMLYPALPRPYDRLNIIPASALVRPLPIEMVGVGVTAALIALRSAMRVSPQRSGA